MQRSNHCVEMRGGVNGTPGPWDGFSDFSAFAMFREMVGAGGPYAGTVPYAGGDAPFHLPRRDGYPTLVFDESGARTLVRDDLTLPRRAWETMPFHVPQEWGASGSSARGPGGPTCSTSR